VHEADWILFFPIDHPFIIQRAIKKITPSLLLIAETEIWPNLLRSCKKRGIPIILFNGRISQKSFRRYYLFRFLFRECLKNISLFLMQTEEDRTRIIKIGAPSERTRVVGNIKFDQPFPSHLQDSVIELTQSIGLQGKESILIAGSTHSGEEEILLKLFKNLRRVNPHLILILAPRHLDRLEEMERILIKEDMRWSRRTSLCPDRDRSDGGEKTPPEVILLDTMGELMNLYRLATLVFIGGRGDSSRRRRRSFFAFETSPFR
jgi:3-deoxy-D-manno-octulosonic-acid transferase